MRRNNDTKENNIRINEKDVCRWMHDVNKYNSLNFNYFFGCVSFVINVSPVQQF